MNNSLKQYIELYDSNRDAINLRSVQHLNALRETARKALDGILLPRKGSDDYEATDLNAVLAPDYGVNINRVDLSRESTTQFRCEVPNLSTCLYYVFNDTFKPSATAGQSGDKVGVMYLGQLVELCREKLGWKKSTTFTMLRKMIEKGFVKNENSAVTSLISKEEVQAEQSELFVEQTFAGSLPGFVAAFLGGKTISDKEAEELRRLIDEHREG